MISSRDHRAALLIAAVVTTVLRAVASDQQPPLIAGLDHVNIAVNDLEAAAARYRALGFSLKPGQPHANGIRNWHAKFPDGTEIELITAAAATDALTTKYRTLLASGDGPAFLALHAPGDHPSSRVTGIPEYIFFGRLNHSPTDKPEHFAHANTANALVGAWVASDDLTPEERLLKAAGVVTASKEVWVPERTTALVARLGDDEIVFLPGARQSVAARRILGVTVRVTSVEAVRRAMTAAGIPTRSVVRTARGRSVFVAPALAHGAWLEFVEQFPQ